MLKFLFCTWTSVAVFLANVFNLFLFSKERAPSFNSLVHQPLKKASWLVLLYPLRSTPPKLPGTLLLLHLVVDAQKIHTEYVAKEMRKNDIRKTRRVCFGFTDYLKQTAKHPSKLRASQGSESSWKMLILHSYEACNELSNLGDCLRKQPFKTEKASSFQNLWVSSTLATQSMICVWAAPASSRRLFAMQNLRAHCRSAESQCAFNRIPRYHVCTLKFWEQLC